MGIHSPFNYSDYDKTCLQTFLWLLKKFCWSCHTSDDYKRGCPDCPVGNLIYECKHYLTTTIRNDEYTYEICKYIKDIHPCVCFGSHIDKKVFNELQITAEQIGEGSR